MGQIGTSKHVHYWRFHCLYVITYQLLHRILKLLVLSKYDFLLMDADLNECEVDPGQCEQVCVDTIAAYECSCWSGYRLENNSRNCSGKN